MFTLKPPMLSGDPARDLAALRDWAWQLSRSLEDVTTAGSTGNVVSYGPNGKQIQTAGGGGGADKKDIDAIRKNASELRDLIIKSTENMQEQIDNIEATAFYVKYADDFTGTYPTEMYSTPTANTVYMGVCTSDSSTAPTDPSVYSWSRIKGSQGATGPQGPAGADGRTTYLHIKYSDDGESFTVDPETGIADGETLGAYIGMYTDYTERDSSEFSAYTWKRFSDDTELRALIAAGDQAVISYVDRKTEEYNGLYVAKSEYGTFTESINNRIETTARGVLESYNYGSTIQSMQDSISLIQAYFTNITGEIRRGIVQDPTTGDYVTGIAISQNLQFSGECGTDDPNNPGDGYTYYYLTSGQTFGLYTSTGWQFWIDGYKKGWFNSEDGMLHVAVIYTEEKIVHGGYWETKNSDINGFHMFEVNYIGG